MSFILDALKKSENERQQQGSAEFSSVPSSSGESQSFKWLWILALLLIVNIAVLVGVLMRPQSPSQAAPELQPAAEVQQQIAEPSFEEKIAAAKQSQPPTPVDDEPEVAVPATAPAARPTASRDGPRILTIDEVRVNGTLQVTDLHLDIHVYSEQPADRFVFINMNKHRENSKLVEGPVVLEITPDGVILEHQGTTFLLPRE